MHRLARDETAALTLAVVGTLLLAHRWLLARVGAWVRQVDDARAELNDEE